MKIDGSCHCGAISYEAEVDPDTVMVCHCTDCQTLSGTAFRLAVPARRENFRLLTGEPKTYVKTSDRGRKRAQTFCANCGTPIYASDLTDPQLFSIRVGTARQRAELPPKVQIWCRSALDWTRHLDGVPQVEKQIF